MNLAPLSDCKQRNNGLDNIMLITYNLIYIYGITNIHTPPNHIKMWVLQKKIHFLFFITFYLIFLRKIHINLHLCAKCKVPTDRCTVK